MCEWLIYLQDRRIGQGQLHGERYDLGRIPQCLELPGDVYGRSSFLYARTGPWAMHLCELGKCFESRTAELVGGRDHPAGGRRRRRRSRWGGCGGRGNWRGRFGSSHASRQNEEECGQQPVRDLWHRNCSPAHLGGPRNGAGEVMALARAAGGRSCASVSIRTPDLGCGYLGAR